MTLRDYMKKYHPEYLSDYESGGIEDCPHTYKFLSGHYDGCCSDFRGCDHCWDQEYIGELDADDAVEHPSHYNAHNIEVIDFIQDWELNFCLGNVIKYVCRSPYKGTQIEDLKKAREYLDFEIKRLKDVK